MTQEDYIAERVAEYEATERRLIAKMVGLKVTNVRWHDPNADEDWCDHDELVVEMEGGFRLTVTCHGYDASGLLLKEEG